MDEQAMRHAIERKRNGERLDAATWHAIIEAFMDGEVDDAQMSALAMACVWRGLDIDEAAALTAAMVDSGAVLQYPRDLLVIDKHSSGGVSDIVSLVAVPLVAACGVPVAKLSGRALGHTGGTIDKLEAIEGFNVAPSMQHFVEQVERIGCAIAAQSDAIVPADKRLYRLRDRTGTVPAIGLIASSIVSKKVAGGASAFVFDVKCGSASFMHDPKDADALARTLVEVARRFDRGARALVTDMNEPLGRCIGTGLEVIEAVQFLKGEPVDVRAREGCLGVASVMLETAGVSEARAHLDRALASGAGYEKLVEMVEAQGASRAALESLRPFPHETTVRAKHTGFVTAIDAVALGNAARALSQRERTAGIRVEVRTGDRIQAGDALATIFGDHPHANAIAQAFTIESGMPPARPLIYDVI
jgi:pyrimidine-nucleoside phosphorylase